VLRRARNLSGLKQDEAAEAIGVTRRTLGDYENLDRVPQDRLEALRALYGENLQRATEAMQVEDPASLTTAPPASVPPVPAPSPAAEDELAQVVAVTDDDAGRTLTVRFMNYTFTLQASPDASEEELAEAQQRVAASVMELLRKVRHGDAAEAG
jgi:transcriptional regulator with XRE-family HTH domain